MRSWDQMLRTMLSRSTCAALLQQHDTTQTLLSITA